MKNFDSKVMASSTSKASESFTESYKEMEIKTDLKPETEVWKKVPGFSSYEVSSLGRVKALNYHNKGYKVVITPNKINNRWYISAKDDTGKYKGFYIAYAVAEAFIPNPDKTKLKYVQFRDGDSTNCNVTNLYWTCRREIRSHIVYVYDKNGDIFLKFESISDAASFFMCDERTMYSCCWKNGTYRGYRMSFDYMDKETFNKLYNPVGSEKTLPVFNFKTPHKTYGCRDLTISLDPKSKSFKKITTGPRAEASLPKVKRDKNDKIVEATLKLDGFKGKKASVKFNMQKDESYEIVIDYPNGASMMVAHCKYYFATQSELMVCAEALDSLYRKIVAEEEGNVKDVYIGDFVIGRSVKRKAA